jgi:hypothetical protein
MRGIDEPNRLILSQEVEDEYREAIFRPKFDRLPPVTVVSAPSTSWSSQLRRSNRARRFGSAATRKTTNILS